MQISPNIAQISPDFRQISPNSCQICKFFEIAFFLNLFCYPVFNLINLTLKSKLTYENLRKNSKSYYNCFNTAV